MVDQEPRDSSHPTLVEQLYGELRQLASRFMKRERDGHTLDTTGLVHEVWLRLGAQDRTGEQDHASFCGLAAMTMRRVLVDHERKRRRLKRGGGALRLTLRSDEPTTARNLDMLSLDEALSELARLAPRQSRVVELRFFGGLSMHEVAAVLKVSESTVHREWALSKAWLRTRMGATG